MIRGTCQIKFEICNQTATRVLVLEDTKHRVTVHYRLCPSHAEFLRIVRNRHNWVIHTDEEVPREYE